MITGSSDELKNYPDQYYCPDHPDAALTVAYHQGEQAYVIRCGGGHFPETITPKKSRTALFKQGELEKVDESFSLLPKTDLETGELLSKDMVQAMISYARIYGLDPYRGHVVIMHGAPYIGIDGYLYYARRLNIPFSLTGRPLTPDELKMQGYQEGDLGWYSKVKRHDTGQEFEGYGFVKKSELTEMSKKRPDRLRYPVVADKPGNMVIKRADWQALRRAFPIGASKEGNIETGD